MPSLNSVEVERRLEKAARYMESAQADFEAGRFDIAATGAYFCAFHSVVAFLVYDGYALAPGGRWSHGFIQKAFAQCLSASGTAGPDRVLRKMLQKLYQGRIVAEYQTTDVIRPDASHLISYGRRIQEFVTGGVAPLAQGAGGIADNG